MAWTPPSDAVETRTKTTTTGGWNPPSDSLEMRVSQPADTTAAASISPEESSAPSIARREPKPERKVYTGSVFDTQPFEPEFNAKEAERLSRREYAERKNLPPRRTQFIQETPKEQLERTFGQTAADTAIALLQGAAGIPKGIAANINAGDNPVARFYEEAIQAGERSKSPFLQSQKAQREAQLRNVLENQGELAQTRAAFTSMFSPAGADVVAQGTGSMLPTLGMSLFGLGQRAFIATNALANAGEAAQNTARELSQMSPQEWSKSDAYQELRAKGLSHADSVRMLAPLMAMPSQLVGGGAGALSGAIGLEKSLAGGAIRGGARERASRAGAELLGEQVETLAPSLAGNITQRMIDEQTSLTEGLGREAVETLFGATPGAALAATGRSRPEPQRELDTRGLAEQMARERGFLTPEARAERPVERPATVGRPAALPDRVEPTFDEEAFVPAPAKPRDIEDLTQQRAQEQADVLELEAEQKTPERFSYMEEAAKYDTPEMRLKQAEALGDDVLGLVFGETESYGRAALKKKSLTTGYAEKMDSRNDAADAATIAFGSGDYSVFTPYENLFPKTAAKLRAALTPKQGAAAPEAPVAQPLAVEEELDRPFSIAEEMEGVPAPRLAEVEEEIGKLTRDQEAAIAEREALKKRTAGTSLMKVLQGTLKDSEMSELGGKARQIGKNPFISLVAKKGTPGSSMEDMVNSGKLDMFLPFDMRPGQPDHDNAEAAEYIREKLRNNQFYTYETELAIRRIGEDIDVIERRIQDLMSDDEINKELQYAANEQREIDQGAQEPAAPSADGAAEQRAAKAATDELEKRKAQLDREEELNQREARLLEERKRLEEERLKLESPTKKDVADQEERKAKAAEKDEREQIRKESEAGAGQFELTREEGRQDTTGSLFEQPAAAPQKIAISPEQERKEALDKFKEKLSVGITPFRAVSARKTQLLKPAPLNAAQKKEILKLASDALDLGLPASVLGNVTAAGSTRMGATAVMAADGSLMIAKNWPLSSPAKKLQVLIHELAHAVDTAGGDIANTANWSKAHTELQNWYNGSANKAQHPLHYPFAPGFRGRVRPKQESFAQAFSFYFTSPVDLQKNAPEAYSQIQAIVERIQDGSQAARAAGTTATGTAGIKVQPARATPGAEVRPDAGAKRPGVGGAARLEDRAAGEITKAPPTESAAFKRWFGDSKIVDADGRPLVMYHGTTRDVKVPNTKTNRMAFFVTPDINFANRYALDDLDWFPGKKDSGPITEGGNVMPLYVSAKNPFDFENEKHMRRFLPEFKRILRDEEGYNRAQINELVRKAQEGNFNSLQIAHENDLFTKLGFDAYYEVERGVKNLAVFEPTQVKSATGNIGTFSPETADINMMQAGPAKAPPTESAAFKRWFGDSKVVDADGNPLVVYHGTKSFDEYGEGEGEAFSQFAGLPNWFAEEPYTASGYAGAEGTVYPVYLSIKRPLSITSFDMNDDAESAYDVAKRFGVDVDSLYLPENAKAYNVVSSPQFVEAVQNSGYDGIKVKEGEYNTYAAFEPTQIKSAIGNIGTYDPKSIHINAAIAGKNVFGRSPLVNWTMPDSTNLDSFIYLMQNKQIDMKRAVDAIKENVKTIDERFDPYMKETLFAGRTATQTKRFLQNELEPLFKEMGRLDVTMPELEEYLHNRHAQERNEQIAKVNSGMPDKGSGIATADAQAYLKGLTPEQKAKYTKLAGMVDAITAGTRQLLVDSGLESQETINKWEETYDNYIPLNRDDIDYSSNHGMGVGQGYSVRGPASRRAVGSERKVVDILANIAMQRERNIVRAEKNRVAMALYGLAIKNPNPDIFLAVNPDAKKDIAKATQELVNMGFLPSDIDGLMKEPSTMEIDPSTGLAIERIHQMQRGADNVMGLRVNGENRYVFFNQNNERAKRMAAAIKNLDADKLGAILSTTAEITRFMAAMNTQYNPIFGMYNFLRDVSTAGLQLTNTPLAGKQKEVLAPKNVFGAMRGIYTDLRAERGGKAGTSQWSKLWEEFQQRGGQTGFRDQFSSTEKRGQALQRIIDPSSWADSGLGKVFTAGGTLKVPFEVARKTAAPLFNWLSDYNETLENAIRLSAYKTALDNGMSKDAAAVLAKELTVNFNRKGQIATIAGALWAFFNASVQGTTALLRTLSGPAGKAIIGGGLVLGGIQAVLYSMAGFDEGEPPEFVREKNFVIPVGNGKYVAIPLPLGYNVIPNTSRLITEAALRFIEGKKVKPTETAFKIFESLLGAFNPIGNAGWSFQTAAPTVADPIVALMENRDWTGKRIAREDFNALDPTPGFTRYKESSSAFSRSLAEFMNSMSGGTKDVPGEISPTPDQIDYLIGQIFGGVGREALKIERTIRSQFTGEELPLQTIPVVGRFYGDTKGSSAVSNAFYENIKQMNIHENTVKGMRSRKENVQQYFKENPEARLFEEAGRVEREVQALRKRRRELVEKDAPKESVRAIEARITARMKRFNDKIRQREEQRK